MSRQIFRGYLLFYLSVSAILVCGSSRRIPRETSCPSCSLDCPEALTVQLPWNSRQEPNLRNFFTDSLQNFPYSRLLQRDISQDTTRDDDIPLNKNSMSFGNYRRVHQREPMSQNLFFKNYLNNSPQSLDRREIFSQDKSAREYPRVVPSRRVFDRSENLFFRNPRNKYSESLSEDYKRTKDFKKVEEGPMSEVSVYRTDRDTEPSWKSLKDTSNVMHLEKSFPKVENIYRLPREDVLDEKRNAIKKSSNSPSQLRYPRERYNPVEFDLLEVKRDPYVKDTDIPKPKEFFNRWDIIKDSQSSNLGQFRNNNNFIETYPVRKQEIAKVDHEQIYSNSDNSKFPQDLNIWKSKKDEELFDSLIRANRPLKNEKDDTTEYFEDETEYFIDDRDINKYLEDETEYFMDDKDTKDYFEDDSEQDIIKKERNNYNPHILPQNIWKGIENEELFNDLEFIRENSQKTGHLGLYPEENNEYFQDEQDEDVIFRDKAYTSAENARAPVINAYNAYIIPRYLNVVNDKKYPAKLETQELSEAKNSVRVNPVKEMNHKFFEDKAAIEDNTRIQDLILSKDIFDVEEYNNSIADKRNNVKNKNEVLTELDPDLVDDIENPPLETTESTLT